jgi:hypothetical protein
LDTGRLQIDQICPNAQAELTVLAALLRRIVSKPWGLISSVQRSALRDVLATELLVMDSKRFP